MRQIVFQHDPESRKIWFYFFAIFSQNVFLSLCLSQFDFTCNPDVAGSLV